MIVKNIYHIGMDGPPCLFHVDVYYTIYMYHLRLPYLVSSTNYLNVLVYDEVRF